jgi:hypothetical protein
VDEDLVDEPGGDALASDVCTQHEQAPLPRRLAGRPYRGADIAREVRDVRVVLAVGRMVGGSGP